ncbi:hypothetical protein CPB83DRAFT_927605 [Crepidotus variabilis]|uniref:Uncharacterized protein n=1 Tax=Crepidotus variabilis TaxID=179855 RepID=A0A9P6EH76_9AGAR|nr:hypothetical protein CPB83DRAFT_927605 [Crepidotus variabilis]
MSNTRITRSRTCNLAAAQPAQNAAGAGLSPLFSVPADNESAWAASPTSNAPNRQSYKTETNVPVTEQPPATKFLFIRKPEGNQTKTSSGSVDSDDKPMVHLKQEPELSPEHRLIDFDSDAFETIPRRNKQARIACCQGKLKHASPKCLSSRGEGSSRLKSKAVNSRNWGNLNLNADEADSDAQQAMIEHYQAELDIAKARHAARTPVVTPVPDFAPSTPALMAPATPHAPSRPHKDRKNAHKALTTVPFGC